MSKEGHKFCFKIQLFIFGFKCFLNYIIAFYKYENNAKTHLMLNPYLTNVPLLNPLKRLENRRFSAFSGGVEVEHLLKMVYNYLNFK